MNKSRIGRIIGTSAILYIAMSISTVLQAGYITGQFSLVQDHDNHNGINQGELVASISFTADDTATTDSNGLSVFDVTRLELIDRTPDLDRDSDGVADGDSLIGNFLYEADLMAMSASMAPLKAFYSPTNAFVGLHGRVTEGDMLTGKMFTFWVHGITLSESTAQTLTYDDMGYQFGDSWAQVPEPSALALFAIGLAGFGVVRLRGLRG